MVERSRRWWRRLLKAAVVAWVFSPQSVTAINYKFPWLDVHDVFFFLVYDYGLAPGARVQIDLESELVLDSTYLMMLTRGQWNQWRRQDPPSLPGPGGGMFGLNPVDGFLVSYWRRDISNRTVASFQIDAHENERYYIGVFNTRMQEIRLRGTVRLVNPGGQELPIEFVFLPAALIAAAMLFLVSGAVLLAALLVGPWRRGRTAVHFVICAVVLMKSIKLFLEWRNRCRVSQEGEDTTFGELSWQLLDKAQDTLELIMFLLVALGWKVIRQHLNVSEVRFAIAASVLSLYLGVCEVACTTDTACSGYKLGRYTLHTICFLVVIVGMNFNMQILHAQLSDGPATLEVGSMYKRFQAYSNFRWAFLAFIGAPTVELFLRVSAMPWDAFWVYDLMKNVRTWAIYLAVVLMFRPGRPLRVIELVSGADRDDSSESEEDVGTAVTEVAFPGGPAPQAGGFGMLREGEHADSPEQE